MPKLRLNYKNLWEFDHGLGDDINFFVSQIDETSNPDELAGRRIDGAFGADCARRRITQRTIDKPQNADFGDAIIFADLNCGMIDQFGIAFDAQVDELRNGRRITRQRLIQYFNRVRDGVWHNGFRCAGAP